MVGNFNNNKTRKNPGKRSNNVTRGGFNMTKFFRSEYRDYSKLAEFLLNRNKDAGYDKPFLGNQVQYESDGGNFKKHG